MQTEHGELHHLYQDYLRDRHLHVGAQQIMQDAQDYILSKTRGLKFNSDKWRGQVRMLSFWKHYKQQRTYVSGTFGVGKRGCDFRYTTCVYASDPRGLVYSTVTKNQERMFFFTGHFFDRLAQRHGGVIDTELGRDLAVKEGMHFLSQGFNLDRDPLLTDINGEAYHIMEGGYAIGRHDQVEIKQRDFPFNKSGRLTICFFKTFLADEDIGIERFDRMLELYRINGQVQQMKEQQMFPQFG